jgi:hypothetical protein
MIFGNVFLIVLAISVGMLIYERRKSNGRKKS